MIISFQRKFVFVAIPKTAGHAIRESLQQDLAKNDWEQCTLFDNKLFPVNQLAELGHGHISCQQIQPYLLPDIWEEYFKFCFVRNPYDRFVSYCCFSNQDNQRMQSEPLATMKMVLENNKNQQKILFRPQYQFVYTLSGERLVDYVGRYEHLQSDFNHICAKLAIPTRSLSLVNASRRASYFHYFDSELQEMVYSFYEKDFKYFNYVFDLGTDLNDVKNTSC
ncbi:MAG: sulfotransferase family protein [Gammaproteobacteria bacterium]|nr:sulfotransferase family protein [Gammaproteobacteria bacterium]